MSISIPSNSLFIGCTNSGKTHSFTYLFKTIACKFNYGILISPTANLNYDYDFMPSEYIHEEFNEEIIKNIIMIQDNKVKLAMKKYGENDYKNYVPNCFIIIDDSIGLINFQHSIFNSLFAKSRHLFISIFVLIQHVNALSPCIRINSSYICITKISDNNIDTIFKMIPDFKNKRELRKFIDNNCKDYKLMFVDKFDPYKIDKIKILKFPKKKANYKLLFQSSSNI